MSNIEAMRELQKLSVSKIEARLRDLSADDLGTLQALETQEDAPRASLLAAVDKRLASLQAEIDGDAAKSGGGERPPRSPSPEDAPPAWCAPDYNGPITADQMAWRREHIKPAGEAITK